MPYIVKSMQGLYESTAGAFVEVDYADIVGRFLSEHEGDGFRLVGIVPQHYSFNPEDGTRDGTLSPLLILHRDEPI